MTITTRAHAPTHPCPLDKRPSISAGHSLRAGFITEAAEQGHHERAIANVSRHRSTRVLRSYVRRASTFDDSAKVL